MDTPSTRTQTRLSGRYLRATAGSRSLARGLELLRSFRLGTGVLTNAELAQRSGLPRPTVSRLTRSLVDTGFLVYDHDQRGYRLGAIHLSLALSFRAAQPALDTALPLMRDLAEKQRINVGIAVLDGTEMVYLDSVRFSRAGIFRRLVPGSRTPAARTALGRAYLSSLPAIDQRLRLEELAREHGPDWKQLKHEIKMAFQDVRQRGYCSAQWQLGIFSVATPVQNTTAERYALNISLPMTDIPAEELTATYGRSLLTLKEEINGRWQSNQLSE